MFSQQTRPREPFTLGSACCVCSVWLGQAGALERAVKDRKGSLWSGPACHMLHCPGDRTAVSQGSAIHPLD